MFQLDVMSRTPVYEQIVNQFEEFVLRGIFKKGDKLPSVRGLSSSLSINPNTIQKADLELDRRGLTCSVPGKGIFVSESALENITGDRRGRLDIISDAAKELKLAGIPMEDALQAVRDVYLSGGDAND